ncbi:hypothetical protein CMV_003948 [Castanea mollissima]|uniref:Uncharacterized protein n=1 Tax=Castanea mollissima TaxID=60419 RepID=A0A8J4RN76_9ROSI|nr:hypothetical protein CMV_003948 [Castanea mollissima]
MSGPRSTIFYLLTYRIVGTRDNIAVVFSWMKNYIMKFSSTPKPTEVLAANKKIASQKIANLVTTDAKALQFLYVFSNAGQLVRSFLVVTVSIHLNA